MKYVVLVSHGNFAEGLLDALSMLAGKRDDVIAIGLKNGMSADQFKDAFKQAIAVIPDDAKIIVLADIIGGSPLTTAMNTLASLNRLDQTMALGGMNLALALTTVLMKDALDDAALVSNVTGEATGAIRPFVLETSEEDEI